MTSLLQRSTAVALSGRPVEACQDSQLLAATATGDGAAFEALYRRHSPSVRCRLNRRCTDPGVAEEVLQDTFLAVWQSAHRWNGSGVVGAWIWGIAVRRLADAHRRPRRPDDLATREQPAPSAEEEVLLELQYGALGEAMDLLTPALRLVIQATFVHQLTTQETAGLLGIPPATVKKRRTRARAKLRQAMDGVAEGA